MEIKKSPKADLEQGKLLSFLLGLLLAMAVVYVSFEARSADASESLAQNALNIADIDNAPIIQDPQQQEELPPEPPKTIEVQLPDEFKVVDNEQKVEKVSLVSIDEKKPLPPPAPVAPPAPVRQETEDREIFRIVEKMPEFPGGHIEMQKWIGRNVRYPEVAADNRVQGRVTVQFVVEKDGSVSDIKVLRGVDPMLDKEAIRVISAMPKWAPGQQRGKPVRVYFTLPVVFQLAN